MKDTDLRKELEHKGYFNHGHLNSYAEMCMKNHPTKCHIELQTEREYHYITMIEAIQLIFKQQIALAEALGFEFKEEPATPTKIVCNKKPRTRRG